MEQEHAAMLIHVGVQARGQVMTKLTGLIAKVAEKLSQPDIKGARSPPSTT